MRNHLAEINLAPINLLDYNSAMKTLSDLRTACKKHNIKVKKETFSWGPHLEFTIDNKPTGGVLTTQYYQDNQTSLEALQQIKKDFADLTIDGQKVYGLK